MATKILKIKYLLLVFLVGSTLGLKAQEVRFGITANPGMIWASADNQNLSSDGVRFSFDFGLVVDYIFGNDDRYAFNTGINLLVAGAKLQGTASDSTKLRSDMTARVNYLEIPLTIKLRSNEVGYFVFYGQLGLVPAFAVRARADYSTEVSNGGTTTLMEGDNVKLENIPFYPNNIEKIKAVNLGLIVEAGFEYGMSDNAALIGGLFFNTGFLDMIKDNDGERVVPRNFGLRIGVLF